MNADMIARIRLAVFALAGLVSASYSIMAIATNTPSPMSPWLPGVCGVAAGIVVWLSARLAGRRNACIAHDELYKLEWAKAVRRSYWFAISLYPIFAILMALDVVTPITAFAAMGTAAGSAPLLIFCMINVRG
ncbi:hypothetical protein [Planktotalea sp.]|uniref:hypothetical protein n=1 Tax=Planktotalea sp. TaxID=2029877 RepID=UPI003296E70F